MIYDVHLSVTPYLVAARLMNMKLRTYKRGFRKLVDNDFEMLCWNDLSAKERFFFDLAFENYKQTSTYKLHRFGTIPTYHQMLFAVFQYYEDVQKADEILDKYMHRFF